MPLLGGFLPCEISMAVEMAEIESERIAIMGDSRCVLRARTKAFLSPSATVASSPKYECELRVEFPLLSSDTIADAAWPYLPVPSV